MKNIENEEYLKNNFIVVYQTENVTNLKKKYEKHLRFLYRKYVP